MARQRPLFVFFFLAYAIYWVGMSPAVLSRAGLGLIPVDVSLAYMLPWTFAPTCAAVLTRWLAERNLRTFRLYGSWKKTLLGASAGSLLLLAAIAVIPAMALAKGSLGTLHWSVFASVDSLSWVTFVGGGPLGEEPGWRGFALPRLQASLGPLKASVVLGVLWTLWHLPLFLIRGFMSAPVPMFAAVLIGVTLIMTFGANLSRFSVAAAMAMHFALNSSGALYGGLIAGAELRKSPPQEIVVPLSIAATAAAIVILTRGRLAAAKEPSPASLF